MKQTKISLIGAGSGCFSVGLVRDLCRSKVLQSCLVSLMDIDPQRLDAIYSICVRYAAELNSPIRFEKTLDRRESLQGADFVINTALTASHDRLREGWKIAEKYGFRLGGSYHVMYDEAFWINFYQLRFFEDVTRDMLEICPDAWHLMVANPVVAGTTYLQRKYPQLKMVGICHGYAMAEQIAERMGYDRSEIHYTIPGVNHFVWLNEAHIQGRDFFEVLDQWIETKAEDYWKTCPPSDPLSKKRLDFYKKHGVVGIGDTLSWSGAAWPWWYHTDEATERAYGEFTPMDGWNDYFQLVERNARALQALAQDPSKPIEGNLPPMHADDLMVPLLEAFVGDIPRVLVLNTLNHGQVVPGVPEDFEVEVPCLCDKRGVHPIRTKPLPRHMIAHILRDRVAPVEMELDAYETGSYNSLRELVLMDKWAASGQVVDQFLQEILDLPYHKEMKAHYTK